MLAGGLGLDYDLYGDLRNYRGTRFTGTDRSDKQPLRIEMHRSSEAAFG